LPGNPASALVTFALLVRPAILGWQGAEDIDLPTRLARLAEPVANASERPHFLRVKIDGCGQVHIPGLQVSHALFSLAEANALLEVPPGVSWPANTEVRLFCWAD
jgi:molybdopterin molybdotransferase